MSTTIVCSIRYYRGKIAKAAINLSKGQHFSKIFLLAIVSHNLVDFSVNDYLGTIEGFRDIKPDTLECNRQKPAILFKIGVQRFYEKSLK